MTTLNTVKIENTDMVRDLDSKAVLNTDANGLIRYKEQRRRNTAAKQEVEETKQRLFSIEREMNSLKKIVCELSTMRSKS